MNFLKNLLLLTFSLLLFNPFSAYTKEDYIKEKDKREILVKTAEGETRIFEIDQRVSFEDVIHQINLKLDHTIEKEFFLDYSLLDASSLNYNRDLPSSYQVSYSAKQGRDYNQEVTAKEKEILTSIVLTLANKSLPKIWKEESTLKKAGDKIDHLHPLRFLMCIFTDEQLKAGIASIRTRSLVWVRFKKELYKALSEEQARYNLRPEQVQNFAQAIGIDKKLINSAVTQGKWDDFIALLLKHVPRDGNHTRYDM